MELKTGEIFNERYKIIQKLGEGGMGAVYKAHDVTLDHDFAIKVNRSQATSATSQFLREARLLAKLRHPNLPRVTDYFVHGEEQYLVMDFVPGDDLDRLLGTQGVQPLLKVLDWAKQLGSALSYLHNQTPPIVHRDIKPANIKLTPSGEVMLVDFGIAKVAESSQATSTGALGYTPGFAPPEQYGAGHTGPLSDQYSLAATLYALLTNQKPVDSLMRLMGQADLVPINRYNKQVPAPIQAAIEKALSVKPEDRFESMNDFMADLLNPTNLTAAAARVAKGKHPAKGKKRLPVWLMAILVGLGVITLATLVIMILSGPRVSFPVNATLNMDTFNATMKAAEETQPTSTSTIQPTETNTPEVTLRTSMPVNYLANRTKLAYVSNKADGKTMQVWLMTLAFSNTGEIVVVKDYQLTFDQYDKDEPAWSPDGTKLLYVAPSGGSTLGLDIWMIDIINPGALPENISKNTGDDFDPAWSPDGTLIAFTNKGWKNNEVRMLFLFDMELNSPRRLVSDFEEFSPTWSPDGKELAFVISAADHQILYVRSQVRDFTYPEQYDSDEVLGRLGNVADPEYSPDGKWIAYTHLDHGYQRIYITPVERRGGLTNQLTTSEQDSYPSWSPDMQWIAFTSRRDGNSEIYIMNLNGQLQTNLTNSPDSDDKEAAWQPYPTP